MKKIVLPLLCFLTFQSPAVFADSDDCHQNPAKQSAEKCTKPTYEEMVQYIQEKIKKLKIRMEALEDKLAKMKEAHDLSVKNIPANMLSEHKTEHDTEWEHESDEHENEMHPVEDGPNDNAQKLY